MAKIDQGYMGGFSGKLGPAVGYMWNGKWCLRSRPGKVLNPRTAAQQEHRTLFREEVRLAARMKWAVERTLTLPARAVGMTAYNLFVSINQQAFSMVDGMFTVDYASLVLSTGPVAPVAFAQPTVSQGTRLEVDFERNPLHMRADAYDEVQVYAWCPALEQGYLTAPVYRRQQHVAALLPDEFEGREVHLYGFVSDSQGRCSSTLYIGCLLMEEGAAAVVDPATGEVLAPHATPSAPASTAAASATAAGTARAVPPDI